MLDPWRSVHHLFDDLQTSLFPASAAFRFASDFPQRSPRVSRWKSEEDCAIYELEAPGLRDDELNVSVEGSLLTIEGKHEAPTPDGYILRRKERPALRFRRQFNLHRDLDPGAVTAELKDGILRIRVAKRAPSAARKITIQAGDSEGQDV